MGSIFSRKVSPLFPFYIVKLYLNAGSAWANNASFPIVGTGQDPLVRDLTLYTLYCH